MSTGDHPNDHVLFVSYASVDLPRAREISESLNSRGVQTWVDRSGIPGGVSYGPEIVAAIKASGALLLLCSHAAFASRNVRQEIQLAWKHERPIVPLLLEPVSIPEDLEYWLEGSQWIEHFDRPDESWRSDVLRSLQRLGMAGIASESSAVETKPDVVAGSVARAGNLPSPATPLVGREDEIERAVSLFERPDVRLVTLTGPGGVGKTRLAIAVAAALLESRRLGVWFVDLSAVANAELVLPTIAHAVGISDQGQRPLADRLHEFLRKERPLLVIDSFEHLLDARMVVAGFLGHAPDVKVMVTSRAPLHVSGEHELQVDPLPLPRPGPTAKASEAHESPAVRLFVQRAEAVKRGFALTDENASDVTAICTRLDGLPLAIEIAASRIKFVAPAALLDRLDKRLPVLTGGARDLPARQQTLRGAISWSFDLLSADEQALLRRLSVFAGGCSFDSIETVTNPNGVFDVFEGVSSLIDKSLLRRDESGAERFRMLETIREFALEELDAAGEGVETRNRHAIWCVGLAESDAQPMRIFPGLEQLERLAAELDNLRAALGWLDESGECAQLFRLTRALHGYWWVHSHRAEGLGWLERVLVRCPDRPEVERSQLLSMSGAYRYYLGDAARGRKLAEDGLALVRNSADRWLTAHALFLLGVVVNGEGSHVAAIALCTEAIGGFREAEDPIWEAMAHEQLAQSAMCIGELQLAKRSVDRAMELLGGYGDTWPLALTLNQVAELAHLEGDFARSADALRRVEPIWTRFGSVEALGEWLMETVSVARVTIEPGRVARLVGAAEAIRDSLGSIWEQPGRALYEDSIASLQSVLGAEAYREAWGAGQELSLTDAVAEGRALLDSLHPPLS